MDGPQNDLPLLTSLDDDIPGLALGSGSHRHCKQPRGQHEQHPCERRHGMDRTWR